MSGLTKTARSYAIEGSLFIPAPLSPGLHIIATPIGNLGDITLRALSSLAAVDVVLCEDTRQSSRLLSRYSISTRLKPYHEHNAARVRPAILADLAAGAAIGLISDAGTPLVSDPGFKLVRDCLDAAIPVHIVPGVSAVVAAVAVAGMPADRWQFSGFLPAKQGQRRRFLESLRASDATQVVFETARRIEAALDDLIAVLGDRPVAVVRELTKLHEEVLRGPASEVLASLRARGGTKGEITVVIGPSGGEAATDDAAVDEALRAALEELPAGQAAAKIARQFPISREEAYARALALKTDGGR